VLSSIKDHKLSNEDKASADAKDKKKNKQENSEVENTQKEIAHQNTNNNNNNDIENLKFSQKNSKKSKSRPEEINQSFPMFFNSKLADLEEQEKEEEEEKEKAETESESDTKSAAEFDKFFYIPKGSIIDSTQKGLFDIGDQISKDTKSIEDEIAEGNQFFYSI